MLSLLITFIPHYSAPKTFITKKVGFHFELFFFSKRKRKERTRLPLSRQAGWWRFVLFSFWKDARKILTDFYLVKKKWVIQLILRSRPAEKMDRTLINVTPEFSCN